MRTTLKRVYSLLLAVVLLGGTVLPCLAAPRNGSITVVLKDSDNNPISGVTVHICQVATLTEDGYQPSAGFENSGVSIAGILNNPDEAVAQTLAGYIRANTVEGLSATADNGEAVFADLALGIWLVYPAEDSAGTFNPYLVFLPFTASGEVRYEVTTMPKLENTPPTETSIYILKKWDDKNNAAKKRPDSVTVELLCDGAVVAVAVLSEENGWAHTIYGLGADKAYSVREKAVADYKATVSGDAKNGFIVTNTYAGEKLPQTGQYWWPIVLIAVAGVGFILLGVYEIGVKKHEKQA